MKFILAKLGFLCLLFILNGCGDRQVLVHHQGSTMGTTYSIKYVGSSQNSGEVKVLIDKALLKFDLEMSNWNPDSWVSLFNTAYRTGDFEVSENVAEIIQLSLDLHQKSSGAFDISVSPLIDLWGFAQQKSERLPNPEVIEKLKNRVGSEHLKLDQENLNLHKSKASLQINCSALAKGFGVDLIAKLLEEKVQCQNFMVEIGGEVRCKGKPPTRDSWRLGIRQPDSKKPGLYGIVDLNNQSLATSGDYHNFFEIDGKRYSHIIDPRTGRPVEHQLCSVSIISPSCALSDGLATACLVLGVEQGMELIKKYPEAQALMIERLDNGKLKRTMSPGFVYEAQVGL